MKNAFRWLSILVVFILAACNPPEPGGDLEQLPEQPEVADVPDLPPDLPVFMHAILLPQPGEVIHQSPYPLIYYGTSFGGIDHFEVWVDGNMAGTSAILGYSSSGPAYGHFFYSEFEWTPTSQGDHTIAVRAVGVGVSNFSEFMSVDVTVDILPSQAGDSAPDAPVLLPECTPADLEAPAIIAPGHHATLPEEVVDIPLPTGLFVWANTAGCIPDQYTLHLSYDSYFDYTRIFYIDGSQTSWPSEHDSPMFILKPAAQYYWTIFASSDGVHGPSTPVRSFFTGPLCASSQDLAAPVLLWPRIGEVVEYPIILLKWEAGEPQCLPDGYRIDLHTDSEFSDAVRSTLSLPGTNWATPELEDCTTYYWRVAALKDGVLGPYSDVRSFTTDFDGACAAPMAEESPFVVALLDQACYLGPNPAAYPIAGFLVEGETAPIMAQDLSGDWWAVENPDADGFCFVRKDDNEVNGDTSGLPTWRDPGTGEAACYSSMNQSACVEAGGTWVEPLSSAPYCSCP